MPILMMKPLDLSLEEIFLQVTEGGSTAENIAYNDENTGENVIEEEIKEEEIDDISENEKEEGEGE